MTVVIIILRALKTIVGVWIAAAASGVPYAVHTGTYTYLHHPETGRPIAESVVCTVAAGSMLAVRSMLEASTLLLFVCPIVLISVLYAMMGIKLRVTSPDGRVGRRLTAAALIRRQQSTVAQQRQHKSRSNVVRMLGISLLLRLQSSSSSSLLDRVDLSHFTCIAVTVYCVLGI